MPTCHVYIATSLDGFIARPDGDIEWLHQWPDIGDDYGYGAFMNSVDGLIIGRGTFEKILSFGRWPYDKPVVVLSRTLDPDAVPADRADRVRILALEPQQAIDMLRREGWTRAYVDGGRLIQSFLAAGLIDDMIKPHAIEDVAREFATRAGEVGALVGMAGDHAPDPQLRQEGEAKGQGEDDQCEGQPGLLWTASCSLSRVRLGNFVAGSEYAPDGIA